MNRRLNRAHKLGKLGWCKLVVFPDGVDGDNLISERAEQLWSEIDGSEDREIFRYIRSDGCLKEEI